MQVKTTHLIIFCALFTFAQFWFAIGAVGMEGKGSLILMAPFRWYFLNWLLLIYATFWTKHVKKLYGVLIFLFAMVLHYAITASEVIAEINRYRMAPTEEEGLGRVLARYPDQLVYGAIIYVLGNIMIWTLFLKRDSFFYDSRLRNR